MAEATGRVFAKQMGKMLRERGFGAAQAYQASVLVFDTEGLRVDSTGASDLLDRHERARAARFRFRSDRDTYVLAHAVWRVALGMCLGRPPEEVPLAMTAAGQPQLPGSALSTSLSHSGSAVAITVCAAATVGVDIERMPCKVDMDALIPVFCTRQEIAQLDEVSGYTRSRQLVELWTRKEALLKAFGVGLLSDPATTPAPAHELLRPPAIAAHFPSCHTRNVGDAARWIAAVASPASVHDVRLHVL